MQFYMKNKENHLKHVKHVLGDHAFLFTSISIVDTFLDRPSCDWSCSEPIFISPIEYPEFSVRLEIICATSTALPIVSPLALMRTRGLFANCISAEVTYAIRGFFPMKTTSFASGFCSVLMH
jgi:hypothetical protein